MHALYASNCDFYVSEDGGSRAKAKMVYAKYGCKTIVIDPEEFAKRF